jgi:phytanoyl-CoA hydroxylase
MATREHTQAAGDAMMSDSAVMAMAELPEGSSEEDARENQALGVAVVPVHLAAEPGIVAARPYAAHERYRVSVQEYVTFREQGFLIVRGLASQDDVRALVEHTDDLIHGRLNVHRVLEIHERFLLHPRVLDVLEALIGPDVMAMQSMLFLKYPGGAGQGYHQDAYYIPTVPDTLCGAWIAIDRADEENGCMWFTPGTQHEPIYPTPGREHANHGAAIGDLATVENVSDTDTERNTLSRIAAKYAGREVPAIMEPGDVAFFGGHVLHRSHRNRSGDRFRRSFVGHYANARSYTQWGYGDADGGPTNHKHILARGFTHLPYGQPRFGTPCAANTPELRGVSADGGSPMMANMADGEMMSTAPMDMARNDPDLHDHSM